MEKLTLQEIKQALQKDEDAEFYRVGVKSAIKGDENYFHQTMEYLVKDKALIAKYGKENLEMVAKDLGKLVKDCKEEIEHIRKFSYNIDVFCGIKNKRMNNNIVRPGTYVENLLDAIEKAHDRAGD